MNLTKEFLSVLYLSESGLPEVEVELGYGGSSKWGLQQWDEGLQHRCQVAA